MCSSLGSYSEWCLGSRKTREEVRYVKVRGEEVVVVEMEVKKQQETAVSKEEVRAGNDRRGGSRAGGEEDE